MNKKLLAFILSIVLNTSLAINPPLVGSVETKQAVSSTISPQEMEMMSRVSETIADLHNDKSDAVWPKYDLASDPIVLTFNNGHIYAFNMEGHDPTWQKLTFGGRTVLYTDQDKWGVLGVPMHPKFLIEGQIAFVFHFDMMQMDPYLPFLVLVHERFHQHQFNYFYQDKNMKREGYQDHLNADNLALMQLEELVLVDFLKIEGNSVQDTQHKIEVLKDFMAVHNARRAIMQPASENWEQHQQTMEGLADYVSLKTYEVHSILAGFYSQTHLLRTVQGYADDESISDRAIKWRHYGVGATMGFALDLLKVQGWKAQVQDEGKNMDDMLSKALGLSERESQKRLVATQQKYGYQTIKSKMSGQLAAYQNEIAGHMNEYAAQDGVQVNLGRPQDVSISGGGSNNHLYYLADGATLAIRETSENRTMDNMWSVSFNQEPFIFQNGNGERSFKVESGLEVTLDGQSYKLKDLIAENAEKTFENISWKGKGSVFQSEQHPGTLIAKDGKLVISY